MSDKRKEVNFIKVPVYSRCCADITYDWYRYSTVNVLQSAELASGANVTGKSVRG